MEKQLVRIIAIFQSVLIMIAPEEIIVRHRIDLPVIAVGAIRDIERWNQKSIPEIVGIQDGVRFDGVRLRIGFSYPAAIINDVGEINMIKDRVALVCCKGFGNRKTDI